MSSRAESAGSPDDPTRSDDPSDPTDPFDVGLLSPVSAGTTGERLTGDAAVTAALVATEAALLRALATTGLAPASAVEAAEAVASTAVDARALALAATRGGNPVIPLVQQLRDSVTLAIGDDAAAWVHFGTTSQDILDTALMLVGASVATQVEADLTRLAHTLAALADRTRAVPVVARTLGQQAMPTTLGLRASGWLAGVHDALQTVRTCTTPPASLGGPVGSAAAYGDRGPDVLEAFAAELGLRAEVSSWHTRRTPMLGLSTALTVATQACAKVAADVIVMAQSEVGEAAEAVGGPSSAMAHKANPAQSVLVVSAAHQVPALAAVLAASAVAEQERPAGAWHAEWQPLRTLLRLTAGAVERTADLTATLRFDRAAMASNLDQLVVTVGKDDAWVAAQLAHVDVWVDRVLHQHEEVCP